MRDLRARVDGDVRFDAYTRQLYATDTSAYEVTPVSVVFPRIDRRRRRDRRLLPEREIPVLPRGGGTSLAGQAVNEAVVLDFTRHMRDIVSIDPDERRVRVQPGTVLADLNEALAPHGLKFAPDPAAGNRSAIGNNSTGAHSLVYGKTDAYVEACEIVLADGTVATLGDILFEQIDESDARIVSAPGASCRTQLADGRIDPVPADSALAGTALDREEPPTPIELLAHALPGGVTSLDNADRRRQGTTAPAESDTST